MKSSHRPLFAIRRMFRGGVMVVAVIMAAEPANAADAPPRFPAHILDLAHFKLTLPVGESDTPREVSQPVLATFSMAPHFMLNAEKTGVVFSAHCGGVTTSGSKYPRSELREMTGGGSAKAGWSTNKGRHRMFLRQAITRVPDHKPHVVAGQIHDKGDDVLVIRLEGRKLFVDHNGRDGPVLTRDYHLGDIFTIEMLVEDGVIKIHYNGSKTEADAYRVDATGCYFKAGCYTQSNPSKGDKKESAGSVVIYDLKVEHDP